MVSADDIAVEHNLSHIRIWNWGNGEAGIGYGFGHRIGRSDDHQNALYLLWTSE
jgi:hypothetical protein